jgi:hypothetical protein
VDSGVHAEKVANWAERTAEIGGVSNLLYDSCTNANFRESLGVLNISQRRRRDVGDRYRRGVSSGSVPRAHDAAGSCRCVG